MTSDTPSRATMTTLSYDVIVPSFQFCFSTDERATDLEKENMKYCR